MKKLILSSAPMTNSEYFEKNNVPFAKVMEIFNTQKRFKSFDKFLAAEYVEFKFKVGDLIVLQLNPLTRLFGWCNNVVFEVMAVLNDADYPYRLKNLTPNRSKVCPRPIGLIEVYVKSFVEDNCILY